MKIYDAKPTFAGGELSPLLYGRIDMAKYATGARELVNFIVLPQGGICNRPGTTRFGGASYADARLVPFVVGDGKSMILVFSDDRVDFFDSNGYLGTMNGSPYKAGHLAELRWLQSNDIIYIFHKDVPVHKMSWYGGIAWQIEEVDFKFGPYREMNTDENKKLNVYIANVADPGDPAEFQQRIGSSWDFFSPDMVGMKIKIETKIKAESDSVVLSRNGPTESPVLMPYGAFTAESRGKWFGEIRVMRKLPDEETFTAIKTYGSQEDYNFLYTAAIDEYGTEIKFEFDGTSANYPTVEIKWDWDGGIIQREFTITEYISPRIVVVDPEDGILGNVPPTPDWAVGAFGPMFGYPAMGIFHQERLILAGTYADPQTIWMSRPASWEDFKTTIPAVDDDSIMVTLASKQQNMICGLSSRTDLLIFTSGGEWVAKAGSKSDIFTPSSIVIVPSGYRGSAWMDPLDIGSSTMFVQRNAHCIRGMGYELQIDGYNSNDMTILSEHLFIGAKIRRWCYQQEPWSLVWVAMSDGSARSFTVQAEHQVQAWARHDFGGEVVDICSIPGDTQDDLFLAVRRNNVIAIELLNKRTDAALNAGVFKDAGQRTVVSSVETLDWEQQVNGTLQGRNKHIPTITMRLHRTCGGYAGIITENNDRLDQIRFGASPGNVGTPYSGDVRLEVPGGHARVCRLRFENRDPQPVTILAVFPEVEISEG